ncbi:peroxidase 1-like protein [Carex littledalei]|uniref:Peroxidase 1-like protein n=1 Tax=Carex littledalei TaxID=544730 RepID=A0A833VGV1_9POAL|nr:peroxidase 1-like protein [Carex littledalei]
MAFVTVAKPLLPILAILLLFSTTIDAQGLVVGFYNSTCPNAETIIRTEVVNILTKAQSLAGPLLRMFFHDCFVNGCDGSVLLNGTAANPAEKDSIPNLSLRGYSAIDKTNGPTWDVPTGRRDGNRSVSQDALNNLPPPFVSAQEALNQFYIPKGLDAKDQLVLSGIQGLMYIFLGPFWVLILLDHPII